MDEIVSTTMKLTATKPIPSADFTATAGTNCMITITVENNYAMPKTVVFTAQETGKYILNDLYGNGSFAKGKGWDAESIETLPYVFDLELGDSIVFTVEYNFDGTPEDGEYYVTINVSKVVTAIVGETSIPVVVSEGRMGGFAVNTQPVMFVAPKTGTYMITPGSREPSVHDVTNEAWVDGFPYTFEANEGDVVWFDVSASPFAYQEVGEYFVDLIISNVVIAAVGTTTVKVEVVTTRFGSQADQVYVLFTAPSTNTYSVSHNGIFSDETNSEWYVNSGYQFTANAGETVIFVVSINPMQNPNGGDVTVTIAVEEMESV